jgi:hypothetical protein
VPLYSPSMTVGNVHSREPVILKLSLRPAVAVFFCNQLNPPRFHWFSVLMVVLARN